MPLIDERGRLFGRVNLIDGLVGLVVLLLIPLAYGAYALFRTPDPTIASIEPSVVTEGEPFTLKLSGENLRPYLKASIGANKFGTAQAPAFLIESLTEGEIRSPMLTAGTYDVVLSDFMLEVARLPSALTVAPRVSPVSPVSSGALRVELQLIGAFLALSPQEAKLIRVGATFGELPAGTSKPVAKPPIAEVLAVRASEPAVQRVRIGARALALPVRSGELQVPAIVRVSCSIVAENCAVFGTAVAPDARIVMPVSSGPPGSAGVQFVIDEVRPGAASVTFAKGPIATIRARFLVEPGLDNAVKVGDLDVGEATSRSRADRAFLIALDSQRQTILGTVVSGGFGINGQPFTAFTATIGVPLVQTPLGWQYKGALVKIGANFTFETTSYVINGWIVDAKIPSRPEIAAP